MLALLSFRLEWNPWWMPAGTAWASLFYFLRYPPLTNKNCMWEIILYSNGHDVLECLKVWVMSYFMFLVAGDVPECSLLVRPVTMPKAHFSVTSAPSDGTTMIMKDRIDDTSYMTGSTM